MSTKKYVRDISLWSEDDSDPSDAQDQFKQLAIRFRQPIDVTRIQSALKVMLDAVTEQLPAGANDFEPAQFLEYWSDPDRLAAALKSACLDDSLARAIRTQIEGLQTSWKEYSDFSRSIAEAKEIPVPSLPDISPQAKPAAADHHVGGIVG